MKTKCNNCNELFNYNTVKLHDRWIGNGIKKKYFNCPKCGHEFIILVSDEEVRRLGEEYKNLQAKFKLLVRKGSKANCLAANKLNKDMKALMHKMDRRSIELKRKYIDECKHEGNM